jgi:NAD(P)-dependent dehydrogenase (short-subunit alcohol dehydrogenase family)
MTTTRPVALVTGASSGIGKQAALALATAGYDVVGTGRDTSRVTPLEGVTYLDLDVASDTSAAAAVQQVIERFGRIDVLVNNAGVGSVGAAEETTIAQSQAVFDINVFGVMRMVNQVLPHMRAHGRGRIINLSSVQGFLPAPYMAVYGASKHAIEGYSQSLDHEVRQHGIRSILVEPAYTRTGFEDKRVQPDMPLQVYAEQRQTPSRSCAAPPGPLAGRASMLHRFAPARVFDNRSASSTSSPTDNAYARPKLRPDRENPVPNTS